MGCSVSLSRRPRGSGRRAGHRPRARAARPFGPQHDPDDVAVPTTQRDDNRVVAPVFGERAVEEGFQISAGNSCIDSKERPRENKKGSLVGMTFSTTEHCADDAFGHRRSARNGRKRVTGSLRARVGEQAAARRPPRSPSLVRATPTRQLHQRKGRHRSTR